MRSRVLLLTGLAIGLGACAQMSTYDPGRHEAEPYEAPQVPGYHAEGPAPGPQVVVAPQPPADEGVPYVYQPMKGQHHSIDAMVAALKKQGVDVLITGQQVKVVLPSDSFFEPSNAELRTSRQPALNRVAKLVQQYARSSVQVTGYTDDVGTPEELKEKSRHQAEIIASYLWAHGVDASRVIVSGLGSEKSVASNDSSWGSAANRRVEISFTI